MVHLRFFVSSVAIPTLLFLLVALTTGMNPVMGQSSFDEKAIVEGTLRASAAAAAREVPQAANDVREIKRYLVQNCVVEDSTSHTIVSQGSEHEDGRELLNGQGGSTTTTGRTCTLEVLSTEPARPLEDRRLDKEDLDGHNDELVSRALGPKAAKGAKASGPSGPLGPKSSCRRDPSLCPTCIKEFMPLQTAMAAGGTINICNKATIEVTAALILSKDTKITCCNNCATALNSRCVLQAGVNDNMFFGNPAGARVTLEMVGMALDGAKFATADAAELTNVNFVLTRTSVEDFTSDDDAVIRVTNGAMTMTESVVQNNKSKFGAVVVVNSIGTFTDSELSDNESTEADRGAAVTLDTAGTTATFAGVTFRSNKASVAAAADIGAINSGVGTCDTQTICNSNNDKVFYAGTASPTCTATPVCPP